jgi:hypothetical protein
MATSITTTYAGEFAGKYVSAALLSAPTIENGGVTVLPNVHYKQVIQKLSTDAILKNSTCSFSDVSTVTLTEKVLTTKDLQVNLELCKKDFFSTWQAAEMGFSSFKTLPKSFADYLIAYASDKVAANVETAFWTGATGTSGSFDGISTLVALDAALPPAQEVAGTSVTALNVVTELGKIVDAIPAALYGNPNLRIYVSTNIAKAYVRALGGFSTVSGASAAVTPGAGVNNQSTTWYSNGSLSIDGVEIFWAPGLASNTAIATLTTNLFFGTSVLSDLNEVKVIDMSDVDGSQNVRVIMRMAGGAQYGAVEDIVTYGIVNSAN